jgi:hypothetical protein
MAAQSSYPAYKAALRTALNAAFAADPALAQVRAYAAMIGDDPLPLEFVEWYGTEDIDITWAALGNLRIREEYTIPGRIFILKPGAGEDRRPGAGAGLRHLQRGRRRRCAPIRRSAAWCCVPAPSRPAA